MNVGEFNGRRMYTGLRLDYRLILWAPRSASCALSAVAEFLVTHLVTTTPLCGLTSSKTLPGAA